MNLEAPHSWIIFGGVFDPIHLGHLNLAREIRRTQNADGILFVPSFVPPHKPNGCIATFEQRVTMLRLATSGDSNSYITEIEAERPDENYTLNTVRLLKNRYPKCDFALLVGADNLAILTSWYKLDELLQETTLLVGSRPNSELTLDPKLPVDRIKIVETSLIDISSSDIRKRTTAGIGRIELAELVPEAVADYILSNRLYQ